MKFATITYREWIFDLKQLLRNADKMILMPRDEHAAQLYHREYTPTEAFAEILEQGS